MVTNGNSERAAHLQPRYSSHSPVEIFFQFFFFWLDEQKWKAKLILLLACLID